MTCTCGLPLTAQHLHAQHMSDGATVLERCRSCPAPVEPGHVRCSACRDELAIRRADARGVGEGFAAVRAARSRRMGERRSA